MSNLEITEHLLDLLQQPAFSVRDGLVHYSNRLAQTLHISEGDDLEDMLSDYMDAYQKFQSGCFTRITRRNWKSVRFPL